MSSGCTSRLKRATNRRDTGQRWSFPPRPTTARPGWRSAARSPAEVKGYPFEVRLPEECDITGAVLSDQVKSLDWRARKAKWICTAPQDVTLEVLAKLSALLA